MAEGKPTERVTYLLRDPNGRTTRLEMDSHGYFTHVFIRTLTEQTGLPAQAISLHVQDSEGQDHLLDPNRMLDEQVIKIAKLRDRSAISTTPIMIHVDENALLAQPDKSVGEVPNLTHSRSFRFRRPCVTVKDPKKTDPVSVIRMARSAGAFKRGGFLWLRRQYLVKLGEEPERFYTDETLNRAMGFAY